jgi:hypothetical protein
MNNLALTFQKELKFRIQVKKASTKQKEVQKKETCGSNRDTHAMEVGW